MNNDSIPKVADLLSKYTKPSKRKVNKAFINLSGGYNKNEFEKELQELQNEYEKQEATSEKFGHDSEQILAQSKKFIVENGDIIAEQADRLQFLETELPKLILENKKKIEINEDLIELIDSEEYVDITSKMRSMKTSIQKLKHFLVQEGIHDF